MSFCTPFHYSLVVIYIIDIFYYNTNMFFFFAEVHTSNPSSNKSTPTLNPNQGVATLLVMLAVLTIIVLFCCFSAPGIRNLCKRYVFRTCAYDDPDIDNGEYSIASGAKYIIYISILTKRFTQIG